MFFSAVGLALVFFVLLLARARRLEDMTVGWRMALYGALGLFFGGFFADGHVSGIFHWYGKTGLLLASGGDVVLWGGVALMVIWIGLRAATRLRYENGEEGAAAAVGRAGSRLDILVIVIAGLALSKIVPNFLGGADAMRLDLAAPPAVEKVSFRMMHVYEDKSRRWASERRDAVFLRENGEELAIPMPVTKSFDEQETLRAVTAAKPGTPLEITYYPHCRVVVSVRPL
jgi:hypothetical protein